MTSRASKVLVIGGGFSDRSAAIELCRQGIQADLAEIVIFGGDREEHGRFMRETLMALAAPV